MYVSVYYTGMSNIKQTIVTLEQAEAELKKLIGHASTAGNYEDATAIINLAVRLKELIADAKDIEAAPAASPATKPPRSATGGSSTSRRVKKGDYPKFRRDGDTLVKIGWSKKEKKVYRHKAPKHVVELLRDRLVKVGVSGNVLAMDKVLPLTEQDGTEVPTYQVYVCMAWFRSMDVVVQEGRQGHRVADATSLARSVDEQWRGLAND